MFNFDVPTHAEDYVHRIGRTGRAGRSGAAFTLATRNDAKYVEAIEQLIEQPIPREALAGGAGGAGGDEGSSEDGSKDDRPRSRNRRGGRGRNRGGDKADAPQNADGKSEAKSETKSGGQRRGLLGRGRKTGKPQNNDAPKTEAATKPKQENPQTKAKSKKSGDAFEGNMPDFLK